MSRMKSDERRSPVTYSLNPQVQAFFEEHTTKEIPVVIRQKTYFADGAVVENSEYGSLIPPPEDAWERAKNIEKYWTVRASMAVAAFDEFSNYLNGFGSAPAHIAHASKDKQLEYLESLRDEAQAIQRKVRRAKKQVAEDQPAWLTAKLRDEALSRQRDAEFKSKVQSIRL